MISEEHFTDTTGWLSHPLAPLAPTLSYHLYVLESYASALVHSSVHCIIEYELVASAFVSTSFFVNLCKFCKFPQSKMANLQIINFPHLNDTGHWVCFGD